MKQLLGCTALLAGLALLTGCAGPSASWRVLDVERIAAVEAQAKHQGVQVVWVNHPTRRTANP